MNEKKIIEKIKEIIIRIAPEFNKEDINWDTNYVEDLLFDSIRFIEMIVELEEEFGIEIDGEDMSIEKLSVFSSLYQTVRDKCNE